MPLPVAAFTFGDALLTVVEVAFMFLWIWIAIGVVFDIFRSSDLSNWGKAGWVLAIFVFPLIGVLGYLIIRGHTMHEHQAQAQSDYTAFRQFQHQNRSDATTGSGAPVDDLSKLAELRDRGVLTNEEFDRAKARALQ
jgi:hypothetical protein